MSTTVKKKTRKQRVIDQILEKQNAKREDYKGYIILTHDPNVVGVYAPRQRAIKPYSYSRYRTPEEAAEKVIDIKQRADREEQQAAERQKEYDKQAEQIQEGTILYSSWGYEQTNIDFYIVVNRSGKAVDLQKIGEKRTYDSDGAHGCYNDRGSCVADPSNKIGDVFRKRINKYGGISLTSYSSASIWDGQPMGWSSYA